MMGECDGLGALQMRISRHNRMRVFARNIDKRVRKRYDKRLNLRRLSPQIHAQIERHLVVAAAGGVQSLARVAYASGELRLYEHVDIFRAHIDSKRSAEQVAQYTLKPLRNLIAILGGYNALLCEHSRMRQAARYILFRHTAVKADRRVEIVDSLVQLLVESACPHLIHNASLYIDVCAPVPIMGGSASVKKLNQFFFADLAFIIACTLMGSPNRLMKPALSFWS